MILITGIVLVVLVAVFAGQNKIISEPIDNPSDNGTIVSTNKVLNLSNQGLKNIPSNVFNQTSLEELNISYNLLTGAIQAEIRHLTNLKVLNASNNLMTGVPAEIGQLQKLEILDLSNNKLTGLPNELGNLKNLKTFDLSGNQYSQQDLDYIRGKLPSTVNIILE
jgi:Leucine-rich repeat (LRR) protein